MVLSKAFDCVRHDLLLAKLKAYGLSESSLKVLFCYLSNRFQRVKINGTHSRWQKIIAGVPQGSILGPLLFNIYLNDLLLFIGPDLCNYADDNTIFKASNDIEYLRRTLQTSLTEISAWFVDNGLDLNISKCKYLLLGNRGLNQSLPLEINGILIPPVHEVKLLGITVDSQLSFNSYISEICRKAGQKLYALGRLKPYLDKGKLILLMKSFIISQFNYCPLIWMFTSRGNNNRINSIHERALRLIEGYSTLDFEELQAKYNSVSLHTINIKQLLCMLYKRLHNIGPSYLQETFKLNKTSAINLRNRNDFVLKRVRSVNHGTETVSFRGPQIWHMLDHEVKTAGSLKEFKNKLKEIRRFPCKCRLCAKYIKGIGYI